MSKSEPNTSLDKYGEIHPSPLLDLERKREEDPLLHDLPTNPKELERRCSPLVGLHRTRVHLVLITVFMICRENKGDSRQLAREGRRSRTGRCMGGTPSTVHHQ